MTPSVLPEHLRARQTARHRETGIQLGALLFAACCIFIAGWLLNPINRIRRDNQLVIDPGSIKGLPPDLSLLSKLGTFRALAIDWASIRADRLKQEGKTYEALQLHQTVCALAPRFPNVWVNAAWNMAYNISVMKYTPEQRWQWVRNGIMLLRDEGLRYNPKAVALYKELAWIYWHKIGDFLDDEHMNYKRALGVEFEKVLGPPIVALTDQDYFDWFKRIVDAPRDFEAFVESDQQVATLVSKLESMELKPDLSLLEFVARYLRPELQVTELVVEESAQDAAVRRRKELLTAPDNQEALDRLLAALRSHVLRTTYKFDLDYMYELMVKEYGPLDWRNGFAHSLYWSSYGDKMTRGYQGASRADVVNTARFVFFSLQNMIVRGRISLWPDFEDPFRSFIDMSPDTRLIPYLHDTYMRMGKEHFGTDARFREGTPGPIYMNGFVTAMHNWIELLVLEGGEANLEQAERYFVWLRENHPHPDGRIQEQYQITVEEFVMLDIENQLQTFKAAHAMVRRFILRALKEWSLGQERRAEYSLRRAERCYQVWVEDTKRDFLERRKMPLFPVIIRGEIEAFFQDRQIAALAKARLWRKLPLLQRQMVYDRLRKYFEELCAAQNPVWEVSKAFGEPADMEEFRKTEIDTGEAPRREGVEQGEIPK